MAQKRKINGNKLATQEDLALLGGQLTSRIDSAEGQLKDLSSKVNAGFAKMERKMNGILKIITSIEDLLKEHKTHPARIARIERTLFHS